MAMRNISDVVGKTVSDVVEKNWRGGGHITWQMFLCFEDGDSVEVLRHRNADWLDCSKVRQMSVEEVRRAGGHDCDIVVDTSRDDD